MKGVKFEEVNKEAVFAQLAGAMVTEVNHVFTQGVIHSFAKGGAA